ncbi:MAG: hypothetical protein NW203_11865 [Hyphomonadaceae bacterium]|nr:hypothetical protein [Hyphomonadaceae bacterium]
MSGKAARNERRKALAGTINAIGIALLVAAVIQPTTTSSTPNVALSLLTFCLFVVSQWVVHYVLDRLED